MTAIADAITLLQQGNAPAARARLEAAPSPLPDHAFLLGACAHAEGRIPEAVQYFTEALKRQPAHVQAACALGSLYAGLGHDAEAEALLRQTLGLAEDRQLRFNLAVVLENRQRPDEARAEYSRLIDADPDDYAARHNRAGLLARGMHLQEAAQDYRELVRRHPTQTLPWQNLADLELCFGHYEAALKLLAEVRAREPDNSKALLSEAITLAAAARFAESTDRFATLKTLDPALWHGALERVNGLYGQGHDIDPRLIYLVRQHEHRESCDWSDLRQGWQVWQREVDHLVEGDLMPLSFRAMCCPVDAGQQRRLAERIARQTQAGVTPYTHQPGLRGDKLRVGYCSSRFSNHATGLLLRRFFQQHDTARVQVYALSLAPFDGSDIGQEIRNSGVHWVDLSMLDDAQAAARIKALNLDILVDCNGYTIGSRPRVLAYKPAPVLVSWLVMGNTTGADYMDYFISDPRVSPGGDWCSEAEVLMPGSYFFFSHDGEVPITPRRAELGLPDDKFVFCNLNTSYKIEPDTFSLWMQLLERCPQSVLWLMGSNAATVLNLKREAEWRGIDPRRLLFAPRASTAQHLARFGAADLFLDTRYYNGHTTVAEALWSGLPAISCKGDTFASRVGHSLLHSCGLDELMVRSWEDYFTTAEALYHDRPRLQKLRQRLAIRRLQAAPFDLQGQVRNLEKAWFYMRERFNAGLKAEGFAVGDLPPVR